MTLNEKLLVECSKSLLPKTYRNPKKTAFEIAKKALGRKNRKLLFEATALIEEFILFCFQKKEMIEERQLKASKYLLRYKLRSESFILPTSEKRIVGFSRTMEITKEDSWDFMFFTEKLSIELLIQIP